MTGQTVLLHRCVYLACWTFSCPDEWALDFLHSFRFFFCVCVWVGVSFELFSFFFTTATLRGQRYVVCVCVICVCVGQQCVCTWVIYVEGKWVLFVDFREIVFHINETNVFLTSVSWALDDDWCCSHTHTHTETVSMCVRHRTLKTKLKWQTK